MPREIKFLLAPLGHGMSRIPSCPGPGLNFRGGMWDLVLPQLPAFSGRGVVLSTIDHTLVVGEKVELGVCRGSWVPGGWYSSGSL